MKKVFDEVDEFLKRYEVAANSHDFDQVRELISNDAIYWFSDGTYNGIKEIEKAFVAIFNKIKEEVYTIENVKWIILEKNSAVCTYNFKWKGFVNGELKEGHGRGTNVLSKTEGKWVIIHEHLSTI